MSHGFAPPPRPPTVRFLLIPVLGGIKEQRFTISQATVIPRAALVKGIGECFDEPFERVNVLYQGQYRDMFVGETSTINGRHIRNIRATDIYRNNALQNGWESSDSNLPYICGPAVLFPDYQVWK
ncbi:hypothetical protein HBA92_21425 [Ochrobactrum sp. MR28]|nr:hypothetical protein [Ochrobactrum sp. MR28]MBX8818830.1 hypothetical protein [Ochrobactrum sp. MR31]